MSNTAAQTVAVAGASGFVGGHLAPVLHSDFELVGLTREQTLAGSVDQQGYRWRLCDLFSRLDTHEALRGADLAVYLVHSARPSARLTQGSVADLDVLCADNFARAAAAHDLDHIVHVTGLLNEDEPVSAPVEKAGELHSTLASSGVPVTTLESSLIVGSGGATTETLVRLVERLPLMGCPAWTRVPVRPIDVRDVARLVGAVLGGEEQFAGSWQVGGPGELSYLDMLRQTAEVFDYERRFFVFPVDSPRLSSLWVSTFGGVRYRVIRQLIDGLRQGPEIGVSDLQQRLGIEPAPFREAMEAVRAERDSARAEHEAGGAMVRKGEQLPAKRGTEHVRSVQRLPLPSGRSARWVAREYARWLPDAVPLLLRVDVDAQNNCRFYLRPFPWPLLVLEFDSTVSRPDRQLFWIAGGMLAAEQERGRLEFREVLDGESVLAAIHEFAPAIPWLVYRFTQAIAHLWVMWRFSRHLAGMEACEDTG